LFTRCRQVRPGHASAIKLLHKVKKARQKYFRQRHMQLEFIEGQAAGVAAACAMPVEVL